MQVLVWNLEDHDNGALLKDSKADASATRKDAPQLQARLKLLVSMRYGRPFTFLAPLGVSCCPPGGSSCLLSWQSKQVLHPQKWSYRGALRVGH